MLTSQSRTKVFSIYVAIPLVVLSFLVSTFVFVEAATTQQRIMDNARVAAFRTLSVSKHPLGLMSYDSSGDLYKEMNSVKGVFDEQNDRNLQQYGETPLTISVAKGSYATLATLKSYLNSKERVHVASHGYIDSKIETLPNGETTIIKYPAVRMHGDQDFSVQEIKKWGTINGRCQLLYLSACYSMGSSSNGAINNRLAQAIFDKTNVYTILGFKGPVDILAATILSQKFWKYHIAYATTGGISAGRSYQHVRDVLNACLAALPILTGTSIGTVAALIIGLGASGVGSVFIAGLVAEFSNVLLWETALAGLRDALKGWVMLDDGVAVPGLSWTYGTGGGGGSSSRPVVTVC
ncbi:MAG: hypothetical protein K9W43_01830 [Candidatus Thorarchaeota archaeon]|nr:hypothetical protein [Candidatus Thorarchaeota archaeon]